MSDERKRRGAGWYVGAAVFWLTAAWIITVGLSSIIPEIFWPQGDMAARDGSCSHALVGLKDELIGHLTENMLHTKNPAEREELSRWLEAWDQRLLGVRASCSEREQKAWTELSRLRHGLRGLVDRFDREQAPRMRQIDALLSSSDRGATQP